MLIWIAIVLLLATLVVAELSTRRPPSQSMEEWLEQEMAVSEKRIAEAFERK